MTTEVDDNHGEAMLSIGALSTATGIPVETLRTWERRYGFPDPDRDDAGHRIYEAAMVEHLRLVERALQQGHRASHVVGLGIEALRELIGIAEPPRGPYPEAGGARVPGLDDEARRQVSAWIGAIADFDGDAFERALNADWHELGAMRFLEERVEPFLIELGEAWASGAVEVAHEHFASERLRDFLSAQWRPLSDRSTGPFVICATLPGEAHALGLQMASVVLALAGCRAIYIGTDTPIDDIGLVARRFDAAAVVTSISIAANRFGVRRDLERLRAFLPARVELVAGGLGAPEGLPDVERIVTFDRFQHWARQLTA